MTRENYIQKEHFSYGHLGLIVSVAVLLVGISFMKDPDLFNVFKSSESNFSAGVNLPKYYAYETPAQLSQPLVAGASTEPGGPMVINEDGTISPAVEAGDVLGADTADLVLNLDAISAKAIKDSEENFKVYISSMLSIESGYLDSARFESSLASGEQKQIDEQAARIQNIIFNVSNLAVPNSFVRLHKLKILQYNSAMEILKRFTTVDENPELVNKSLTVFLQAEQQLQSEVEKLNPILNSLNYE